MGVRSTVPANKAADASKKIAVFTIDTVYLRRIAA
jgi:hypothetical protein